MSVVRKYTKQVIVKENSNHPAPIWHQSSYVRRARPGLQQHNLQQGGASIWQRTFI